MKSAKNILTKIVKAAAVTSLKRDANQTSCGAIFQPKIPADLVRYKKEKR